MTQAPRRGHGTGPLVSILAACLTVASLGCGGATSFHGNVFRTEDTTYTVGLPGDTFHRIDINGQNDLAWADGRGNVMQVNSSCDPTLDIPLIALTNQLLIGFTERDVREQQLVAMTGREALRTHAVAKLDGVPRELTLTVLKKNGCVFDFALVAAPGADFTSASAEYDRLLAGFATDGKRK